MTIIDQYSEEELRQMVAESKTFRELSQKIGYTPTGRTNDTIRKRLEKYSISTEHFTTHGRTAIERNEENVFCEKSTATQAVLRRWYLKGNYSEYKCAICGLPPIWNDKELVLTLDHINGCNNDNRLNNLRWICPNCDRQLPTFAGKKSQSHQNYITKQAEEHKCFCKNCGVPISRGSELCVSCYAESRHTTERPSPEILREELITSNFAAVGRKYGVTDNTIRKWCKAYGMSTKAADYK